MTFSDNMRLILFDCVVSKNVNSVCKKTTIGYDKVVMVLSFVGLCMVLVFLLVHDIASISYVTSVYYLGSVVL